MGDNTHNEGSPMWDVVAAAFVYTSGRKTPPDHKFSPGMSHSQYAAVLNTAGQGTTAWVNAHPLPVRIWLNNRTPQQREDHRQGCLETMALFVQMCDCA